MSEWLDELAIDAACQGFPQRLNRDEQIEAIRRMSGLMEVELIAYYIGSTKRQVHRLQRELGAMA